MALTIVPALREVEYDVIAIEGYADLQEVGRGGFGVVYRARDQRFDRDVAIKVLYATPADDDARRRFERECQAAGSVSAHPNIVTVYAAGVLDDGRPYLVMEYMAAGSLASRIAVQGALHWTDVAAYGVSLAGALHTAHLAGILHRDVKPENVLFTSYGEACLADFGVARIAGATETRSGVITASLHHAAPEIIAGGRPSVAADIYALGSSLVAALLARAPFESEADESLAALIGRIATQAPPDLSAIGVPQRLTEVLDRALAKSPSDRWLDAEAFGVALQEAQAAEAAAPTLLRVDAPVEPTIALSTGGEHATRRRDIDAVMAAAPATSDARGAWISTRRTATVAALVAVVIGGGIAAVALTGGPSEGPPMAAPSTTASPSLGSPSPGNSVAPGPSPAEESRESREDPEPSVEVTPTPRAGTPSVVDRPSSSPSGTTAPSPSPVPSTNGGPVPTSPPEPTPGATATPSPTSSPSPANAPPVLPAKSFTFEVPVGQETVLASDDRFSSGWSDPDGTADWLCLELRPRTRDYWLDGMDCAGKGLRVTAPQAGTYVIDYLAKECTSQNPECGPPYSKQVNTITVIAK